MNIFTRIRRFFFPTFIEWFEDTRNKFERDMKKYHESKGNKYDAEAHEACYPSM